MNYYPIDETLARRAKEMNSYSDYVEGSATAEYRRAVDQAASVAEQQKRKVDPRYHEKIDRLLDTYARKLAENTNKHNAIVSRVPSILVAGGGNFPVRKKEKQNRADEANMAEWREIQGLLDKIRGTGKGGISSDDPEAVQKLKAKLQGLEQEQEKMKAVNAYYRKNKTLDGCPLLTTVEIEKVKASMGRSWRADPKPYESYALTNNSAVIRQTKARIEELSKKAETEYEGWTFDGGEVKMNREANRLQVFFDEKPDKETCAAMRHGGFRWAPSVGAWQRQLNDNAIWSAKQMDFLRPLSVEQPTQAPEQTEPVPEPAQKTGGGWRYYIIADLKTWADNAENRSPIEHYSSFEEAKARFEELRSKDYNSEAVEPGPDGQYPTRLALGLESADGMSAIDILHVRRGQNYLVDDFTHDVRLWEAASLLKILSRVSKEIGFDRIRPYERMNGQRQPLPDIPFEEWDNPYFSSGTPGSIAAHYCDFLHACYPLPEDGELRAGQIGEIVQFIQREGKAGVSQLKLAVAALAGSVSNDITVQKRVELLTKELAQYQASAPEKPHKERKKTQPER